MVDVINLYENPWDIASSGTDTLPRGLNPNVYGSSITDPSLYRPLFSSRLATLSDAISCVITEEINGTYTLNMTYPVDGNGAGLIKAGRIIAAKNYPKGSRQLFKITQISKTLKNTITVSGEHLSYDLSDYTLQPITGGAKDQETGELKPISATLNKAIEYIQGMDQYSPDDWNPGWIVGDIYNRTPGDPELGDQPSVQKFPFRFQVASGYYDDNGTYQSTYDYKYTTKEIYSDKIGTVREYVGAAKTGLLSVYGGEVIFDIDDGGYADVIFTPQMGQDRGFKVVYGKNLKSMNYKIQAGKQKSAWFPYYKYTMNSDLHINLFWEIDNDLSTERARQIIGSGVNPYEGQIKPPLVYEHMDDFQSYVNIFPVDVTSEVDQFLKLIGESWGHITPDSHDQPGEAEDKSIMRSWALSVGLSAYWDVNGTLGYAPTSSELTFDFASLYATDSNAVEADVRLGDTVTVIYDEDGTSVKKRVIKIEYDAATGRYKKITLGDPKNKRKTAAGSIAESSLNSTAAIDTAYANAASFKRDVLELVGTAFNSNLTVTTPLEKTYSIDSVSKNPSMALEIKGTTNDDGKCLTWRHNTTTDTWSAVWEEVSRDHYTGLEPIDITNQNVIRLLYNQNDLGVDGNHRLYIKNPVPSYTDLDAGEYLRVYHDTDPDDTYINWGPMSTATSSVVGGIKTGYTTSGTNFAVQLDQNGKAFVAATYSAQNPIYLDGTTFKLRYSSNDFVLSSNALTLAHPLPYDGSDGQVLMWSDGPDWTTLTTDDISNIETWISGKSYATTTYVNEIASGLSAAYSIRSTASVNPAFNTQADYITITSFTTTGGDTISFSDLKVGDTVYVVDSTLPDRWVSEVTSSNAKLYILETVQPAVNDVQVNSSSIVSNRTANIALSSSFSFNTSNNTLSLQKAGSSTLGGIKTDFTTSGTSYKVQVDSNGNAYVVVPKANIENGTTDGQVLVWNGSDVMWRATTPPWYLASNPNDYISLLAISATSPIAYDNSTGIISVASGYTIPTTSSYTPSVWNDKQDSLGSGTIGQVLYWNEGGPYWDDLPAQDTYTLTHPNNTNNIVLNKNGTAQNTITLGSNAWNSTAIPTAYTSTPANVGTTGSAGSSTKYAKGDHVHAITVTSGPANGQVTVGGTTVSVAGLQPIAYITNPSIESGQRYLVYDYTDGYTWDALTWADIGSKPTTISGYGITDAKIQNGVITLGSNTITPVTSIQFGSGTAKTGNAITVAKADITALGIPGSDTNTTYTLNVSGTGANAGKVGLVAGGSGSGTTWYTIPYATVAGEATKDSDSNTIANYYGHALTVSSNKIGLKNAQDDDITGSFITVPYATVAGSANSVAWANVTGHAAGVKADLAINASSGSTSKYLSEQGTWVSLPSDVNTWRDIGVNGSQWKTTSTSSGAIDFNDDTGISITTGTGQNANKLYIGLANTYGDTKNPYASKTQHYVLAAPSDQNGVPSFRALITTDISDIDSWISDKNYATTNYVNNYVDAFGTAALQQVQQMLNALDWLDVPNLTHGDGLAFGDDNELVVSLGTGLTMVNGAVSLADAYGDTKNPYGTKSPHYVLAGPSSGSTAAAPTFRALVADDIPDLAASKITSGTFDAARIPNLSYTKITGISGTSPISYSGGAISLSNAYGDTKNPYGTKTPNYVLAGPASGTTAAAPTFRALVANDIPNLTSAKITDLGDVATLGIGTGLQNDGGNLAIDDNHFGSNAFTSTTIPTTYLVSASVSGNTLTLVPASGSNTTFTDTNTTYTLEVGTGDDDDKLIFSPSSGNPTKVTVPYAVTASSASSVAWASVAGHDAGVDSDLGISSSGSTSKYLNQKGEWATPPNNNTTYAISGALSSHKFTTTLTATNPSGTSTTDLTLVQGSNVTLTDDTTNRKITIAATDTTYSFQEGTTDGGFQYKVNSGSWQNVAIHNAATIAYVNEKAAGLSASYAINTSSSVNPAFNVQTASITVTSFVTTGGTTVQASSLKVGDTVYVTNSDIPDRWVGAVTSSNATLYVLETVKAAIVDVKFDSTSLLNTSTRTATLNHGKAIDFNTTDKTISVNIDTNTMAYVDSDTKIGVDTTKIPLSTSLGDLAWLDTITNAKITGGTSGYLLKSNGTSAASWVSPSTLSVSYAASAGTATQATDAQYLNDGDSTRLSVGSATNPVYFSNGIPSACTYSLNKTVPSDAVFTDTKVTQTATTTSAAYELLFSATADNTTRTEGARKNNNLTFNPSTGDLSSIIYTMMVGTTAKASMQYNSTTDAIDFVFVA